MNIIEIIKLMDKDAPIHIIKNDSTVFFGNAKNFTVDVSEEVYSNLKVDRIDMDIDCINIFVEYR